MSADVVGMMDASCPKCHRRFGWQGRIVDRPPCPRCGHQMDRAKLEKCQADMNAFRQMQEELRQANPNWDKWQKARIAAGLTLRQAAKLVECEPSMLCDIEHGRRKPSEALAARMARCYEG